MGTQPPPPKGGGAPLSNFRPISIRKGKERKSIYIAPFRTKVLTKRSGMDHTVLPANNTMPAYCGQTAGCIKMPIGTAVGLSPGEFVLDGDPAPLPKRGLPILRVEVRISKLDRKCRALPVVASFVALEQQIILVKTRSE